MKKHPHVNMLGAVMQFHQFFGHPMPLKPEFPGQAAIDLRLKLEDEENKELHEAIEARDIVAVADALADKLYVTLGTALAFGIPMSAVFAAVHAANMRKAVKPRHDPDCSAITSAEADGRSWCDCGAVLYHPDGKTKKPEGWVGPEEDIKDIIHERGYYEL